MSRIMIYGCMASMIVAVVMIIFVFFYDRSQLHIGTVLYQIVYSLCVDLFANAHIYSRRMWISALLMLLGIILFAIGTGLYAVNDAQIFLILYRT